LRLQRGIMTEEEEKFEDPELEEKQTTQWPIENG
jgi:hypothetical protein